jgi:dipeptidyl aminopeptidase/acylaminoacyl peptidase
MNVPKGSPPADGFPLLILNHGYIDPAVYTNGRGLMREQDYLARQGFVVIHTDYRNHADSSREEEAELRFRFGYVEDSINAVLAAQNSGLDFINGDKVGMLGHSMGGGVAQNVLVVVPELVDAAVLLAPVSSDQRDNFERWISRRSETAAKIEELYGTASENPEFWDNLSANTFFDRVQAPVMIHHGSGDDSVPFMWSSRLQSELEEAGKTSVFHLYPGEPHEFVAAWNRVMERTVEFFNQHLK